MSTQPPPRGYAKRITVTPSVIDVNGHVNNVAYAQWMQELAIEHYALLGGPEAEQPFGTWWVREHRIEYFLPGFLGDEIEARTWVENYRRVRSLRRYEFLRARDGKTLVKGETDWVFVDTKTGRPMAIPDAVRAIMPLAETPASSPLTPG